MSQVLNQIMGFNCEPLPTPGIFLIGGSALGGFGGLDNDKQTGGTFNMKGVEQ